jgi:hypothetical protein
VLGSLVLARSVAAKSLKTATKHVFRLISPAFLARPARATGPMWAFHPTQNASQRVDLAMPMPPIIDIR